MVREGKALAALANLPAEIFVLVEFYLIAGAPGDLDAINFIVVFYPCLFNKLANLLPGKFAGSRCRIVGVHE